MNPNERIRVEAMKKHPWWKKYCDNYYPEGLIVGYHKIPIDHKILQEVKLIGIDPDLTEKSLETNMHNNLTTTYYLLFKKHLREGNIPRNSLKEFDKLILETN